MMKRGGVRAEAARMSALAALLTSGKVDQEKLEHAGLRDLTSTAGQTWAQLLKP